MTAMPQRLWFNKSQPQTLQIATFLLYANAAFILLYLILDLGTAVHVALLQLFDNAGLARILLLALAGAQAAAGNGLANERKWSIPLGIGAVSTAIALNLYALRYVNLDIIPLLFDGALLVALLHRQTRDYQKIWFK